MNASENIARHILESGRSVMGVVGGWGQTFGYTIGNSLIGKPELILVGNFDFKVMAYILNTVSDLTPASILKSEFASIEIGAKYPVQLRKPNEDRCWAEYMHQLRYTLHPDPLDGQDDGYTPDRPPGLLIRQLVLCNPDGFWPWELADSDPFSEGDIIR